MPQLLITNTKTKIGLVYATFYVLHSSVLAILVAWAEIITWRK